ncbi:MAG: ATP-binding cassette domain-containing protein [Bdellovibrionota bacterium]|nr:ATP-binding cassette domain-containing protein [Bdellovibrionota bacterium]
MSKKLLEIENITVRFGGVIAVNKVNFSLEKGELVGFIGPNGAGKTTLMKTITGMVEPQEGKILLNGELLNGKPIHERINLGLSLAQQIVSPLNSFNCIDNVVLACGKNKTKNLFKSLFINETAEEEKKAKELLEIVGLGEVLNEYPETLPLGYLKRLEVARALALDPLLLLLDEPLAGLNQKEASSLGDLIVKLNKKGQTILLIEHNLKEVIRICKKIYVQDNGRSLAYGDALDVMKNEDVKRAYLGTNKNA